MVSRMNYPQILAEIGLIERFLPPAVKKSSRFIYLEMISAACSFMLEQAVKQSNKPGKKES